MNRLILLFCFLPFFNFAQPGNFDEPDKTIIPDPYNDIYYTNNYDYSKIKSIVYTEKLKSNDFRVDTLMIEFINEKGFKESIDDKSASLKLVFDYNENSTLKSFEGQMLMSTTKVFFEYDDSNRTIQTNHDNIIVRNNDSIVSKMINQYFYNEFDITKIVTKKDKQTQTTTFTYDDKGQLIYKNGIFNHKTFDYYDNGNLERTCVYQHKIAPDILMSIKRFEYDNKNRLIRDSIVELSYKSDGFCQITEYEYNDFNLLTKMNVSYGNAYRHVNYEYDVDKLKQITVNTNSLSPHLRFLLPISTREIDKYSIPIIYKEIYEYDDYGNKVATKVYINDELYSETKKLIEYRNR